MIVGSSAARWWGMGLGTEGSDLDVMVYDEAMLSDYQSRVDSHIVPKEIYDLIYDPSGYVPPEVLLTLKMSHLPWDIKWDKTKRHIITLLNLGFIPIVDMYQQLKEYWGTVHGDKKFLSLSKTKDEFFSDNVSYKYDHDYLHELVAFPNRPMYTKCLTDGESVLISEDKFRGMDYVDQVRMFREEVTVIAIERWLTNDVNRGRYSWYESYLMALKKTITNLTKNWANDFVIMNIRELSTPKWELFEHALNVLGEKMSEVDLKVFQDIVDETNLSSKYKSDLDEIVYLMCENDFNADNLESVKSFNHLDQEGGGEGGAEYCYGVFELNGVIYKAEYSYYSYHGAEYDGITHTLRVCKPVEKTITVYE